MEPRNLPEKLIWTYIVSIYAISYIGGLYLLAPLLAFFLTGYLVKQWWYQTDDTPPEERIRISIPTWIWVGCMSVVALVAIVGGLNFDLPLSKIVFTLVNRWYKTWALLALFPLIGHLNIRPQLIYRAVCIFCIQSLIIVPIFAACIYAFNSQDYYFLSPLSKFGGGEIFYNVRIFGAVMDGGERRLQMMAPWPPALGLMADIFFCLCLNEKNKLFRFLGMAGAALMTFSSVSRAAIICLPLVPMGVWILAKYSKPWMPFLLSGTLFGGAIFYGELKDQLEAFKLQVNQYRSGSSRAREAITQLAIDAWQNEAPIWGHGTFSENGPISVGRRGIGSHHTWYGILYAHGLMGAVALSIAFLWSFFDLLPKLTTHRHAAVGLSILGVLLAFSFIDNIDGLAYLYWPGLVILGIAFKEENLSLKDNTQPNIYAY